MAAGVAAGPDGLYFAPLYPDAGGDSAIYKLAYTPGQPHPHVLANEQDAEYLMAKHGCLACHSLAGSGGSAAPPLDRVGLVARVQTRLKARSYWQALDRYDQDARQPPQWRAIRQRLRVATPEEQVVVWVQSRIQEPRFDNPAVQMPNFGLSQGEAETIARYLAAGETATSASAGLSLKQAAQRLLPARVTAVHLAMALAIGFLAGCLFVLALRWLPRRGNHRGRKTVGD